MKNKIICGVIFTVVYNIQVAHAEFLNMGTPEWIILILTGLFFIGFFALIIFLILFIIKRLTNSQVQTVVPNSVEINFGQSHQFKEQVQMPFNSLPDNLSGSKIALPFQYEIRYVSKDEIVRCEADDNYTRFFFVSGEKLLISKSLKEYSDLLKPKGFIRTHQSHLVNPEFVKSWLKEDGGTLLMSNGDKIPVSKPNREAVKAVLAK